jgi:hypothetical protein
MLRRPKHSTIELVAPKEEEEEENALLRVLLECIGSCLKSVLRYKFLISYIFHSDTLYLHEQGLCYVIS